MDDDNSSDSTDGRLGSFVYGEGLNFLFWTHLQICNLERNQNFKPGFKKFMSEREKKINTLRENCAAKLRVPDLERLPGEVGAEGVATNGDSSSSSSSSPSSSSSSDSSTEPYPQYHALKIVGTVIYTSGRDIREALEPHVDDDAEETIKESLESLKGILEGLIDDYKSDFSGIEDDLI